MSSSGTTSTSLFCGYCWRICVTSDWSESIDAGVSPLISWRKPPLPECSTRTPVRETRTASSRLSDLSGADAVACCPVTITGGSAMSNDVRFIIVAPVYVSRLKNTIDVRMSISGTRLMCPPSSVGARSARRWMARWKTEPAMGRLPVPEAHVGAIDGRVDQPDGELVDLLDDRFRLAHQVRVRRRQRNRDEEAEAGGIQCDGDAGG